MDRLPAVVARLASSVLQILSPLVRQIDFALDWVGERAWQTTTSICALNFKLVKAQPETFITFPHPLPLPLSPHIRADFCGIRPSCMEAGRFRAACFHCFGRSAACRAQRSCRQEAGAQGVRSALRPALFFVYMYLPRLQNVMLPALFFFPLLLLVPAYGRVRSPRGGR